MLLKLLNQYILNINKKKILKKLFILIILINNFFLEKYSSSNKVCAKYSLNPVLGNNKTGTLFDPYVIKNDNLYKMFVSWRPKGAIALSTSRDGIIWSNLTIILNKGEKDSWESIVNRGCLIKLFNKYYLWYTGQNKGKSNIGFAISNDGINFIKNKNNPILKPEFIYEKESVMIPNVIYDKDENIFKMWYSAGETYEPDVICYATSKDGINWKKYKNNPIFIANKNKLSLDSFKVGGSDVHKISKRKYIMFYIGYSDINTARIFVAKSKNGINNWKRSDSPIISPTKNQFDNDACYKPSSIYDMKNRQWLIWYNGRRKHDEYIGLAYYNKYHFLY